MKVIFLKDHPCGIEKGTKMSNVKPSAYERWLSKGYVELFDETVVDVEKPKVSLVIGGETSKKKQSKQSKSGKNKKKK